MHPAAIIIPAAVLIFGPRAWVHYLLKKFDQQDLDLPLSSADFARKILDQHGLHNVRVEATDIGDHYDHIAKAVRISRGRYGRKTLTAMTTTAHEVAHALQDANDYAPFVWRAHLAKIAQVAGQVGSVVVVAIPLFSLSTHRPLPVHTMGSAIFAILGTGMIAQLSALPSEFDASFNRALPMLRAGYIDEHQSKDAQKILFACSLTYIAASMVSALNFWPWYARRSNAHSQQFFLEAKTPRRSHADRRISKGNVIVGNFSTIPKTTKYRKHELPTVARAMVKPAIKAWLRLLS